MGHVARWLGWGLLWLGSGCIGRPTTHPAPPPPTPEQIEQLCNGSGGGRLPAEFFAPEPTSAATPPAPTSAPVLPAKEGHTLLAIDPTASAYRAHVPDVCMPENGVLVSTVHICVNESGNVTRVEVLKGSKRILDDQLPEVIGRWKFHPYAPNGTPIGFCYNMNYRVAAGVKNH